MWFIKSLFVLFRIAKVQFLKMPISIWFSWVPMGRRVKKFLWKEIQRAIRSIKPTNPRILDQWERTDPLRSSHSSVSLVTDLWSDSCTSEKRPSNLVACSKRFHSLQRSRNEVNDRSIDVSGSFLTLVLLWFFFQFSRPTINRTGNSSWTEFVDGWWTFR